MHQRPGGSSGIELEIVGKVLEVSYYKLLEKECEPGEILSLRTSLCSVYKRTFTKDGK